MPNPLDALAALEQAVAACQAGDFATAADLCGAVLAVQPDLFEALLVLAAAHAAAGRAEEAVAPYARALQIRPDHVGALSGHGDALAQLKRFDAALTCYDRAVALAPADAVLHFNRGNILKAQRRHDAALASYDRALALRPDFVEALNNRGTLLARLGRWDEALSCCDRALAIRPGHGEALANRAQVLLGAGRLDAALACCDAVLTIRRDADVLCQRAAVLTALNRFPEALASCDAALALAPAHADAFNARGNALKGLDRFADALACYDRAVAIRPDFAGAFCNRGICLQELGRHDDAVASFAQALIHDGDLAAARFAACMAELPILYRDEAEIAVRRAAYERRLRTLDAAVDTTIDAARLATGVGWSQPFYLAAQGRNDRDLQARYGALVCRIMAKRHPPARLAAPPAADAPVRVGIVSGFFRQHANWSLPIKGWLSQLDRGKFRLFGYHTGLLQDQETREAAALCDRFVQGPLSVEHWRAEIAADAPHVLIYPEVGMDGVAAQLAALRLAPVQCNSWGHPETSGYPTLDYFLGSDLMEPPDGQDHYTERLVRLPRLSVYCEPMAPTTTTLTRAALGLRETATVYWCCQSLHKYLPQYDHVFARIARAAGDCQFAFIQFKSPQINAVFHDRLDRAFAACGRRAADHCVLIPRLDRGAFLAAAAVCDVFLDSIGWSGCNSALESLDLPIVTLPGQLMRSRHAMAFLEMMGVTRTIASSIDDYVAIAVRLAHDRSWRLAVKADIAANKHRLYRDRATIVALEAFLSRVGRGG